MDPLRLDAAAARVVAWHNRHPLARRIAAAHVQSVGYVALPFERPRPGAGAKVAAALEPVFSEDFLDPLKARQVARWAVRQGLELPQDPADAPLRHVRRDRAPVEAEPATLYLLTAAIEVDSRRSRVLLGVGDPAAVLGRRLWSGPRVAAAAVSALAVALVSWGLALAWRAEPPAASAPVASAPVGVAAVASAAAASASVAQNVLTDSAASNAPAAPASAAPAASTAAPAASAASATALPAGAPPAPVAATDPKPPRALAAAPPASAPMRRPAVEKPVDLGPHLGRLLLPNPRPPLSEAVKAQARQAAQAAREGASSAAGPRRALASTGARTGAPTEASIEASTGAPRAAPASVAASARGAIATAPAAPALAAKASAAQATASFAVTTRALRTRAEAEQIKAAMDALLRGAGAGRAKVEILAQGDDWRVVGWPFPGRDDAEKARAMLVARGMRVAVVGF